MTYQKSMELPVKEHLLIANIWVEYTYSQCPMKNYLEWKITQVYVTKALCYLLEKLDHLTCQKKGTVNSLLTC